TVGLFYSARLEGERNEARNARDEAEAARDDADQAKTEVERQKGEVEKQRDLVRRTSYAAHMNLAAGAWREGDRNRMLLLLNGQRPERTGGQELRGFEWYYLWRLANAGTLKGHTGAVRAVAFSPDGTRLASGGGDPRKLGEVKVWDLRTGQEPLV